MTKRQTKPAPDAWRGSPEGHASYLVARAEAQAEANRLGFDFGLEPNDLFKSWRVFMLPGKRNRYGHEMRCEVVSPENLDKCQSGHGPMAAGRPGD